MALDFRRRLFARYYDRMAAAYEERVGPQKDPLFAGVRGTVVEIGPGTGANLARFPEGVQWIGIEPNPHMHPLLRARAEELGMELDIRGLSAEELPLEDASVDVVLSTLVMCSVPDLERVLTEIRRVLKPGGRFIFWEHVAARPRTFLRGLQHAMTPLQRFLADGCRANRDLGKSIRGAGFSSIELEEFSVPAGVAPAWIRPHIRGIAVR